MDLPTISVPAPVIAPGLSPRNAPSPRDHKGLMDLLSEPEGFRSFLQCLQAQHCGEHLIFWKKVELFHTLKDNSQIEKTANDIWLTHLAKDAGVPVTTSTERKKAEVEKNIQNKKFSTIMFDSIQSECLSILHEFWILTYPQNTEELRKDLLAQLTSPSGFVLFEGFLQTKYCDEYLLFWHAVESFRSQDAKEKQKMVQDIYVNYLAPDCKFPICCSVIKRKNIKAQMDKGSLVSSLFDEIQDDCVNYLLPYWCTFKKLK